MTATLPPDHLLLALQSSSPSPSTSTSPCGLCSLCCAAHPSHLVSSAHHHVWAPIANSIHPGPLAWPCPTAASHSSSFTDLLPRARSSGRAQCRRNLPHNAQWRRSAPFVPNLCRPRPGACLLPQEAQAESHWHLGTQHASLSRVNIWYCRWRRRHGSRELSTEGGRHCLHI